MALQPAIADAAALREILGRPEADSLEFKARAWFEGRDAAGDVAGMANAFGGQILLGVEEDPQTKLAARFGPWGLPGDADPAQTLFAKLVTYLRPRDFVDAIRMDPLEPRTGIQCMVLSIPPSAGLVGVALDGESSRKGTKFAFPIRVGRETRWMEYDEILRRLSDGGRAASIRLSEFQQRAGSMPRVKITSPIVVHSTEWVPLFRLATSAFDATLGDLFPDSFVLNFVAQYQPALHLPGGRVPDVSGNSILIPYSLVRSSWPEADGSLGLDLAGRIALLRGQQLRLLTG